MALSPVAKRWREVILQVGESAIEELKASNNSADIVGAALKGAHGGKKVLEEQGGRLLGAMGFATTHDLDRVSRKIGKVRKRLLYLLDALPR